MALQNDVTELERKHQALEREIQDAMAHPSTDNLRVAELKRRKLQLKDEITKLKHSIQSTRGALTQPGITTEKPPYPRRSGGFSVPRSRVLRRRPRSA